MCDTGRVRRVAGPITPWLLGIVVAALAGAGLGIVGLKTFAASTSPVTWVGQLGDFAAGSATKLTIKRPYLDSVVMTAVDGGGPPELVRRPQANVFIVRGDDGSVDVLIARDTQSGCVLSVNPGRLPDGPGPTIPGLTSQAWFFDPCHGSGYDQSGAALSGPAPRNLDRFSVVVDQAEVLVDVGLPIRGARRLPAQAATCFGPARVGTIQPSNAKLKTVEGTAGLGDMTRQRCG